MHELKPHGPSESAVRSIGIVVPLLFVTAAGLIVAAIIVRCVTGDDALATIVAVAALIPSKTAKYIRAKQRHNDQS